MRFIESLLSYKQLSPKIVLVGRIATLPSESLPAVRFIIVLFTKLSKDSQGLIFKRICIASNLHLHSSATLPVLFSSE
ncbi:MAG: hypothetical protein BWY60_00381 [Actinobacteria bacterium ADurb.Bin346]|nr:MAG: hypothetical protein BWY60_00381 [Actinobacteria bacterium ADurb.Bin346]